MSLQIYPLVKQLWPPEGDSRVTNMDVVFFSDLEEEIRGLHRTTGQTWLQKGHPEVCWPQQWLPEDLGSNVRIFEIRPFYLPTSTVVLERRVEEAPLRKLNRGTKVCLDSLHRNISIGVGDGYRPLVFVGHGYGRLMLKETLVKLHSQSDRFEDLRSNLCGIVFYAGTNTKFPNKGWPWRLFSLMFKTAKDDLSELSKRFEADLDLRWKAALDLKKVNVCVVNKNKSILQEIKDHSDLEGQFIDVMDSNDTCTPTSKEDPSYYTLLEFLQRFLPKVLHQTIYDKKGQEVRLRLSERKDKEALGDMEIASASTREIRDKEMDVRQYVVLHVVGNVDEDHDMLVEEAHKLEAFLCQKIEMAQGHGGSIILPNLHELHSKFLEDTSIFAGARKNVEMDSIEFLFLDAQCMSKVVGVGLHQALVTVTSDNDVKVEALSERAWESLLASMFMEVQDSGAFELIGFKMPKMEEDNNKTMSLPSAKEAAKQFGVGLKDFQGDHIVTMNKKGESSMFFPVILKVAEVYKALKDGDPHVTKRPSGVGSSTGAAGASSSGGSQQGKEEGKSVRSWSVLKLPTWLKRGKGDEKDDEDKPPGGDPPPNFGPSSEPELVPRTYTVKVYPEAGHKFRDAIKIPPQIQTTSMKPKLTIVFFQDKTGSKFLNVTTQTQCNLGCHADTEDYFGWFQDDIKISFRGSSLDCKGTGLKDFSASVQGGEKGELTKTTTNITLGGSTSVANLESRGMFGQGMVAGSGIQVQVREDTTQTFGQNSSRADTEEILGVKQMEGFDVRKLNFHEDLIYKFCIPTSIKDSNNPKRFLRYSDTFTPIIVGNWDVSKENTCEAANYTFKVGRHLFHIEQGAVTSGRGYPQDYVLEMFINLKMTHLDGLRSDKTIEIHQEKSVGSFDKPGVQLFPVQ